MHIKSSTILLHFHVETRQKQKWLCKGVKVFLKYKKMQENNEKFVEFIKTIFNLNLNFLKILSQ